MQKGNRSMKERIREYSDYLREERHSSENTILSYNRDLKHFCAFMENAGVTEPEKINRTNVMAYIYELQKQKKASATVSRNVASIRSFFSICSEEALQQKILPKHWNCLK